MWPRLRSMTRQILLSLFNSWLSSREFPSCKFDRNLRVRTITNHNVGTSLARGCSFIRRETASFRTTYECNSYLVSFSNHWITFPTKVTLLACKNGQNEEVTHVLANIQAGGNLEDMYAIVEYAEIITSQH
jgi:hypothetical protein